MACPLHAHAFHLTPIILRVRFELAPGPRGGHTNSLDLKPDLDLIWGSADNCPQIADSLQGDSDGNGVGDACEGP